MSSGPQNGVALDPALATIVVPTTSHPGVSSAHVWFRNRSSHLRAPVAS